MKRNKDIVERDEEGRHVPYWSDLDDMFRKLRWDVGSLLSPWDETRMPFRKMVEKDYIAVDMKDEGDHFAVNAELPGIPKEDIEIEVDDDLLTISAEGGEEKEEKEEDYLVRERSSYSTSRSLRIPEEILQDKVKATMKDGVLHLTLPKKEPKPKKKAKKVKIE